jgi:hypothetical protein
VVENFLDEYYNERSKHKLIEDFIRILGAEFCVELLDSMQLDKIQIIESENTNEMS